MICLKNISRTFNKGTANEVRALSAVNLDVAAGEFTVLLGANGSGKSSLINIIAGSDFADEGLVLLDNQNVSKLHDYQRSRWVSRIFQNPLAGTASDLSIVENFRMAALRKKSKRLIIGTGKNFRREVISSVKKLGLGLEKNTDQKMGTLSGGQRQALTLLMATFSEPKILLLDEPAAALDPRTAELVMELGNSLIRSSGSTALLITHQLKDAINYGDRVIQLQEGRICRDLSGNEKKSLGINDLYSWFSD